ncbi:hypothetical protein ACH5RR_030326 [Cinchona calisaya]|uniref:FBD domain-containing protein n=1 Tax=Cinchona calisaya TaxID=153742 RepID=A0ABD2YXZ7_9GENT
MTPSKSSRYGKLTPCDRISDLPGNIIDSILMCLSTRDAARTSILSKKWRYKWTTVPQLVLDDTIWGVSTESGTLSRKKFVSSLYQILSLRQGTIFKFVLSTFELESCQSCPEIDNLIVLISRSGVKEFIFKVWPDEYYKMPSSFFSCQELRQLNLWSCLISPPTSFKGFSLLISLKLRRVYISAKVLGSLISSCPLLEKLKLQELYDELNCLEIIAPKLKSFIVESPIKSIFFKKTPALTIVALVVGPWQADGDFRKGGNRIVEHFGSLPTLENMRISNYFIKSLAAGGIPTRLSTAILHLKVLKLLSLFLSDDISFVLCLLRSSPNLQDIYILVHDDNVNQSPSSEFLGVQDHSDVTLNQLREVKLECISGTELEMELIRLLLENSPVLEKMTIEPNRNLEDDYNEVENEILKKLNTYRRASRNARIIYE